MDPDLWNEHRSRYLFASRLSWGKRVLDLGCGTGYGSADLAGTAAAVVGVDSAEEAITQATEHYTAPNLAFLRADASRLPFPSGCFDLIVGFEIIEHLESWERLLEEAARVLSPEGQFLVSTPNKSFYAESRRLTGPNPFHEHEFEFGEFRRELEARFSHVSLFVQNHGPSITIQPTQAPSGAEVRIEGENPNPEESNFFLAVCASTPQTGSPAFVHLPSTANVLRERDQHIVLLEGELKTKNQWLDDLRAEHQELVDGYRGVKAELEERNQWADTLDKELSEARTDIDRLNAELAERAENYERKISALDQEKEDLTKWTRQTETKLESKLKELADCVGILHETEKTVEERTAWAQSLNAQVRELEARVALVESSRWVKLGRSFGVGPEIRQK